MVSANFRFYAELNEFLAPGRRRHAFDSPCAQSATVKHMIEALGVPHIEVELVLVNGESVGFGLMLEEGDRVAVYPKFEAFDISPLLRVRDTPLRIVLTRDRDLLKRRSITHGCDLHAQKPAQQLRELFERLDLARSVRQFSLCLHGGINALSDLLLVAGQVRFVCGKLRGLAQDDH